jgi:hypothetical protein
MEKANLYKYWDDIPTDETGNPPVDYTTLCYMWNVDRRTVRAILAELSAFDNGDGFILIRSSHNAGFFKTQNREKIAAYRREVYARAMNTLKPLKKIKRVLSRSEQITIDDLLLFGDGVEPFSLDD